MIVEGGLFASMILFIIIAIIQCLWVVYSPAAQNALKHLLQCWNIMLMKNLLSIIQIMVLLILLLKFK